MGRSEASAPSSLSLTKCDDAIILKQFKCILAVPLRVLVIKSMTNLGLLEHFRGSIAVCDFHVVIFKVSMGKHDQSALGKIILESNELAQAAEPCQWIIEHPRSMSDEEPAWLLVRKRSRVSWFFCGIVYYH